MSELGGKMANFFEKKNCKSYKIRHSNFKNILDRNVLGGQNTPRNFEFYQIGISYRLITIFYGTSYRLINIFLHKNFQIFN